MAALSPEDSGALDTYAVGSDGLFAFPLNEGASQMWQMQLIEIAAPIDPLVVDPANLGQFYTQVGQLTVDPYSGLGENTVRIRLEPNVLYHVRDASAAYFVSSS